MRLTFGLSCVAALLNMASVGHAADSTVYRDAETGFTFSQYLAPYAIGRTIAYRIAIPSNVPQNTAYDAVIQVVAPTAVGWAGLAWGGRMTSNPLSVGWANGNTALVSSRYTAQHAYPPVWTGATYQLLTKGTRTNGTHWQYTAKCTGCTSYLGSGQRQTYINPQGTANRVAYASNPGKPTTPSSASSSFPAHDVANYFTVDFVAASNPNFEALVTQNL